MEVESIVEDCGYPTSESPKSLRGKISPKYDGRTPLQDLAQEEYIHRIIFNMGDRKKAYEEVYFPNVDAPNYSGRAPYRFFERKGFMKRYKYLMDKSMFSAGLDKSTLLLKTASMIDKAVKNGKVRDFTSLVDTVLKLQVDESKYTVMIPNHVATEEDLKPVQDLMEKLNG